MAGRDSRIGQPGDGMTFRGMCTRGAAALLLLSACSGAPNVNGSAEARMPTLTWQGVDAVHILCLVGRQSGAAPPGLQAELCEKVRALAADNAPVPVSVIGFGDPAVLDPGKATLLVHGAVQGERGEAQLVFTVRTYRAGRTETDILFGAPPRAVPLTESGAASPALHEALAATLAETLPWMRGQ